MLDDFHFLRPYFLLIFFVLFAVVWMTFRKNNQSNSWLKICDPKLVSHLLVGVESRASIMPVILLLVVGSLFILALAGPAWQKLPQAVFKNEEARVYILDLSRSMDATDVSPSRLTRAKLKLIDFLRSHKEGQIGLIAFAGMPHVVSPLTDDSNTIIAMVPSLSTDIMPVQGSSSDKAILKAAQLLKQSANPRGDIVLLTDGINVEALNSAQQISTEGYHLHVVGVGTAEGAPIPVAEGGFLNDKNGAIVIPKLDTKQLRELALAGAGQYTPLTVNDSDIKKLNKSSLEEFVNQESDEFREMDIWRDEGHWLLILALPLAALGFRRGWLGVFILTFSFMPVEQSMAFEWSDLWQRKDQQAQQALQQGDTSKAAELFENAEWKGTAYYRDGNYGKAAEAYAESESVDSRYNLANALARQGKFEEALSLYDEVIKKQPDHTDAQFNRELIKKAMQQQQQNSDQKQENNQDQKDQDSQSQNQNQSQEGDSQQQENQSQNQDQQDTDNNENKQNDQQSQQQSEQSDEKNDKAAQEQQEQQAQEKQEEELKRQQESEKGDEAERLQQQQTEEESSEQRETRQATQQWLRRIPDDPGGLMREKFHRQSQRERQRSNVENPW